ncbi:DNA sulfur modification protein DndD [Aeromonas enteropelogenes]|uniref:DNA sulfur modification protein DndD n=1 Tax=Aeromonas enteropelogenes TaxID=29489 RepID=UPI001CE23CD5|nr:DNA sulfur modification protein DndD [Aeromonas enteropelogenes]UCA09166.1 DNA sulfur modification protein DndD [Aeromonas enteropelogenes]
MIIKKLVLHNFRVFRGHHEIELTPQKRGNENIDRPIVLFGGLNGAGKTSILSAIRLALYGRLAFDNLIHNQDYIDQLTALIHNGVSVSQQPKDASIELVFTYNQGGTESEFTVIRSWNRNKKDRLKLLQNGVELDELNYEQCQGFLNELIPHGIADLFFFDGEKIASLAEDESGKILQTAVRRLLGLDLIAKLRTDLGIYLKQQGAKELGTQQQHKLAELEQNKKQFAKQAEHYRFEADLVMARIGLITQDIQKYEAMLAAQGGAFARTKNQEQQKVAELVKEKEQLEKSLRHECDGSLPFALAPNTMAKLQQQLAREIEIKRARSFSQELNLFLEQLKANIGFKGKETLAITTQAIEEQLDSFMANKPQGEVLFDISERETHAIIAAISEDGQRAWSKFDAQRRELAGVEHQLEQAASNIERAPDDEQLMDIFQTLRVMDSQRQEERHKYKALLEQAKQAVMSQLDCARQIQKLHDKAREQYGAVSAVQYANETISLLDEYSDVLTQARVKTLEQNFEVAYRKLARKEDLQIKARINPHTFDVELVDEAGIAINRKSLSAGEKQIYAIAILEALAKTSGRQLPVIIDTPLGRLDSHHRDKLIHHYFPFASHQVILLSTDTEVDERYFASALADDISHAYQIRFDALTKSSKLTKGYFWKESPVQVQAKEVC